MKNLILISLYFLFSINISYASNSRIITHIVDAPSVDMSQQAQRIKNQRNLILPVDQTISFFYQLNEFDLGRFLIQNRGLNGYWISHVILGDNKEYVHPLENWFIKKTPTVIGPVLRIGCFAAT